MELQRGYKKNISDVFLRFMYLTYIENYFLARET